MPTKDDHLDKAEHNERFYQSTASSFVDWAIAGLFYCALHYVDAYLATLNINPRTHSIRGREFQRPELQALLSAYNELKSRSEDARYGFHPFGMPTLTESQFVSLRDNELAKVKSSVKQLLGMP